MQRRHGGQGGYQPKACDAIRQRPPRHMQVAAAVNPSGQPRRNSPHCLFRRAATHKRAHPNRRKHTERRPQKVHLSPAVVDVGLQRDNRDDGHHKTSQQHDAKAGFAVAEGGERTRDCLPKHRSASDSAQQQRDGRRGYRKPYRDVVPRHSVSPVNLAHKQVLRIGGMLGKETEGINEPQRVVPVVRVNDVCDYQRRRREYADRH